MQNWLKRYEAGECREVWAELRVLEVPIGHAELAEADAVVCLTMQRVRANLELLNRRLLELGYEFGYYPDRNPVPGYAAPLHGQANAQNELMKQFQQELGTLPMSLLRFGNIVGSVNFIGFHTCLNGMLDPLVVEFYEEQLDEYAQWKENLLENGEEDLEAFLLPLSPDDLHKDNVSGASPCGMTVPAEGVDGIWEPSGLYFVDYLRELILQGAGFAGYKEATPEARRLIGRLAEGLQPF